ncbi:MAG: DUF58 domain-containing protein [Huintestinicola sp.]|uniref:DUF58 domain-containing protein n=1 Tax=Huintestinicola sp. TaxID=2981661 RepID=UPI003F0F5E30
MTKLLYILILIGGAAFYLLFADTLSFVLLISLIILPVILLVELIISSAFLRCSEKAKMVTAFRGEPCEAAFLISNNSVFPLPNTRLRIKTVCYPGGETSFSTVNIPLPALRTETVTVTLGSEHCCRAEVTVESIKIYDLLRLFSAKRFRRKLKCTAYIIPKLREQYSEEAKELLSRPRTESAEDAETVRERGNGIPGDVCGFREFLPGDRLSLMHYKLSARFDKDIVKILNVSGATRFLLTADLSSDEHDKRDCALERLMSVAYYLALQKAEVFAAVPSHIDPFSHRGEGLDILTGENGFSAVRIKDGSDYFAAARLFCGESFPAAEGIRGFINQDLSGEK